MNRFEDELRAALRRVEAPAGFADRVMARVPARRTTLLPRRWMAAAAALVLVAGAGSWEYQRSRERRLEAERAKAELLFALELTSSTLHETRSKVLRLTGGLN